MSLSPSYSGRKAEAYEKQSSGLGQDEGSGSRYLRGQGVLARTAAQKKKGRAFHKLVSGIQLAELTGGKWMPKRVGKKTVWYLDNVAHLVLTSAAGTKYKKLNEDFQKFWKRLCREYGRVAYCKIKTTEGFGVLHVLIRTKMYVPQAWVSENWNQTHKGSSVVWINRIYGDSRQAAGYLASQYCSGQEFDRLSASLDWIKKGAYREWRNILSSTKYQLGLALSEWQKVLADVAVGQQVALSPRKEHPRGSGSRCNSRKHNRKSKRASS